MGYIAVVRAWCERNLPGPASPVRLSLPDLARTVPVAVGLVLIWCFACNFWFLWGLRSAAQTVPIAAWQGIGDPQVLAERCIAEGWAPANLRARLYEAFAAAKDGSAYERAVALAAVGGTEHAEASTAFRRQLLDEAMSRPRGWYAFWPSFTPQSGRSLVEWLEEGQVEWRRMFEQDPDGDAKRQFLIRWSDAWLAELQGHVRDLQRYNGWVQWLTYVVFATTVLLLLQRRLQCRAIRAWTAAVRPSDFAPDAPIVSPGPAVVRHLGRELRNRTRQDAGGGESAPLVREEFDRLCVRIEDDVYRPLAFLAGMMPSLGFIGTVLGMGSALLAADGLFAAADRQTAIKRITSELGLAFDTTLIALVLSIAAGLLMSLVRGLEHETLHLAADRILDYVRGRETPPLSVPMPVTRPWPEGAPRSAPAAVPAAATPAVPGITAPVTTQPATAVPTPAAAPPAAAAVQASPPVPAVQASPGPQTAAPPAAAAPQNTSPDAKRIDLNRPAAGERPAPPPSQPPPQVRVPSQASPQTPPAVPLVPEGARPRLSAPESTGPRLSPPPSSPPRNVSGT